MRGKKAFQSKATHPLTNVWDEGPKSRSLNRPGKKRGYQVKKLDISGEGVPCELDLSRGKSTDRQN